MVQLSSRGLAEGAGEEDTGHVHDDRADEDVRRPVVHLAYEQAAAHGKGDVDRRGVGLRHPLALQRRIAAVVHDLVGRGYEIEGQEDTGGQQDNEGVQGDLAQHEGPVVREDLVEKDATALGHTQAVVQLADGLADAAVGAHLLLGAAFGRCRRGAHVVRSQNPGPTG